MNEKKINARFTPKGDIEANWKKAVGFVPLDKEVIIYKPDENYSYSRIKVGDGVTGVNDLPFVTSQPDYLQDDSSAKDYIKNRPFYSEGEKTEVVADRTFISPQQVEFIKVEDTFENAFAGYFYLGETEIIVNGGQYILTIDEEEHQITPMFNPVLGEDGALIFGNLGMLPLDLPNTGENYVGYYLFEDKIFVLLLNTGGTHTIGLSYANDTAPIVAEGTYTFSEEPFPNFSIPTGCTGILFENLSLEKDSIYNISLNGNTYKNLTFSALPEEYNLTIEGYYIGNLGFGNGVDTGENCLIIYFPSVNWIVVITSLPAGDYTFSLGKVLPTTTVTTEIVHKIDYKFVPQSDYSQSDPNGEGYIKNRPFYSKITYHKDIIPLQNILFQKANSSPAGWLTAEIELDTIGGIANGGQYNLTIDNTTYLITLKNRSDLGIPEYIYLAGNLSAIPNLGASDTGEPYFIIMEPGDGGASIVLTYRSTASAHRVGLSYIGDTVPLIIENKYEFEEIAHEGVTCYGYQSIYETYYMRLQENDVFNIIFNGKSYKNLTYKFFSESDKNKFRASAYLGNASIIGSDYDTGEDWCVIIGDDIGVFFVTNLGVGPHTLSMEKATLPFTETIQKIDKKFLEVPYTEDDEGNIIFTGDAITFNGSSLDEVKENLEKVNSDLEKVNSDLEIQADYNQNDNTAKDYIKNKPFYIEEDNASFNGTITAGGIILDSSEKVSQNYIVLKDIEEDFRYVIQIKGGNLVTKQLPVTIQVITPPNKTEYYRGEYFDPTGMVVAAVYNDGTTEIVDNYSILDINTSLTTVGEVNITLRAKIFAFYETIFTVNVIEFNPDVILIDFNYSKNEDGTYTLTSWKGTLNGQRSTDFIVPNNSLIKI